VRYSGERPSGGRARRGRAWIRGLTALVVVGMMSTSTVAFAADDDDPEPPPPPTAPPSGAAPAAPSNFMLIRENVADVVLGFTDNSTNETRFVVERKPTLNGVYETVKTIIDSSSGQPARKGKVFQTTISKAGNIECYRVWARNGTRGNVTTARCIGPTTPASYSFNLQKPWNLAASDRYSYNTATRTHTTRVYATDKPHEQGSPTKPRTEMRWNSQFSTGRRMWEADVYIPAGSGGLSGTVIAQVKHRDDETDPSWSYALEVSSHNGGTFWRKSEKMLMTGVYNKWWNIKLVHDAGSGLTHVYVNDRLEDNARVTFSGDRNFKNGVYGGDALSIAHFRNIRHWV
jgi:hypothetical protein